MSGADLYDAVMDLMTLLVGIGTGLVVGGGAAFAVATALGRARSAATTATTQAALDAARAELEPMRGERDRLRSEAAAAATAEASAKALYSAAQTAAQELRAQVDSERTRAEQESKLRAKTQEELRAADERLSEREVAMKRVLDEREKALAELKANVEQSRAQLTDVFKAAGADVLKSTAETLLKQAKEQFEGQKQLSSQELEARQKAIDATIAPLKEQLAKQEALVMQLNEKREGDAKTFSESFRQISELQQKAWSAAHTLSSALKDNRHRGQWGEAGLRTVVELAGLVEGVHFTQQQTFESAEGRLRPDMVVRLPGERFIPIDSKVPLGAYLAGLEEGRSDTERAALRQSHADAVRSHVRALAQKNYAGEIPGEIEFTVLYIEVESAFTAAFETDASLHQEAMRKRVLVVTPSTLLALLRTIAMHWSNSEVTQKAAQIRDEAKEMVDRVGVLVKHLNTAGQRLGSTVDAFNKAIGSFDRMFVPQLNKVASIVALPDVKVEEGPSETPRRINRTEVDERELPELASDAEPSRAGE